MSIHNRIQDLQNQIQETKKLLSLVVGHPIMEPSLKERLAILEEELSAIPKNIPESKIRLLFSGDAVVGSLGIKSDFVSKTIKPLQDLIKTQTAIVKFGQVGQRGKAKKSSISELYLTALPTGSFGYELSLLDPSDLFDEEDVSKSIQDVVKILEGTAKSDDNFQQIVGDMSKRAFNNLSAFFKEVANENSILKLDSGTTHIELTATDVKNGYVRVSSTQYEETPIVIKGIFKGILLDSGKFEIINDEGLPIRGDVDDSLDTDILTEYNKEFTNEECTIHLQENLTIFNEHKRRLKYVLLQIK